MVILKYDLEGNFLESYDVCSLVELSNLLNLNYTSLTDNLKKRNLSCCSFQFIKKESDRVLENIGDVTSILRGAKEKPVVKKYKGKFISFYTSVKQASEKNNLPYSKVQYSIKTGKDIKGFKFLYV